VLESRRPETYDCQVLKLVSDVAFFPIGRIR
jgi:hypothetical protein